MITLTTGDLLGILGDVVDLAHPDDKVSSLCCVRIEWDGAMLHAIATDGLHAGISSWHPEDGPADEDSRQDVLFAHYGGADDPWSITITLEDARDVMKKFKLSSKYLSVPLDVGHLDGADGPLFQVRRRSDSGHPALTLGATGIDVPFPDVRAGMANNDRIRPVKAIRFNAVLLSHFGHVRQRGGEMTLTFTGEENLTLVAIGPRFVGAIRPISRSARLSSVAA